MLCQPWTVKLAESMPRPDSPGEVKNQGGQNKRRDLLHRATGKAWVNRQVLSKDVGI
jgi:hypothetical protein